MQIGLLRTCVLAVVALSHDRSVSALLFAGEPFRRTRGLASLQQGPGLRAAARAARGGGGAALGLSDDDGDGDHFATSTFVVPPDGCGVRLDKFLSDVVPDQSRTYLASLCADGHVMLARDAGVPRVALTKKSHKVSPGDNIEVSFVLNDMLEIVPEDIPLDILYEVSGQPKISRVRGARLMGNATCTLI